MVLLEICPPKSIPNQGLFVDFLKILVRPLQFLQQIVLQKSSVTLDLNEDSVHQFAGVLKHFSEINCLHIQLPCHGGGLRSSNSDDSLLKWKAEFGRELESCVLLGATSFQRSDTISSIHEEEYYKSLTADELKLRVMWMISSLFAASARHCLLKQFVDNNDHKMLRSVVIADASKQGRLWMRQELLEELRTCVNSSMERTRVPALRVKLWSVSVLELPESGRVMQGATLVIIGWPVPVDP